MKGFKEAEIGTVRLSHIKREQISSHSYECSPTSPFFIYIYIYIYIYLFIYLFIRLHGVLVAAHRIFLAIHELICPGAYRILVPQPGI